MAGNGSFGFAGDGGPATAASLANPTAVAVGSDNSLYIADFGNHRVRRVAPDGTIGTLAGTGVAGFNGDSIRASTALLNYPTGIAVGIDGSVYIADRSNNRVRVVGLDGLIQTYAGTGTIPGQFGGDGGPATSAPLSRPSGLSIAADSTLYIADDTNLRVRRVAQDGLISTVAGNGNAANTGDGGAATAAALGAPIAVAVGPDLTLVIADRDNNRVRRVTPTLPNLAVGNLVVPSSDGSELYVFNGLGQHQQTVDTLTNSIRYAFQYDTAGRLSAIQDTFGNVTSLLRPSASDSVTIVGPYGQSTLVSLDGSGYAASSTDPLGDRYGMSYVADGLLNTFENPRGLQSLMQYNAEGRLISDQDAAGAAKTLARTNTANGWRTTLTSALGVSNAFQTDNLADGSQKRTNTFADGTTTTQILGTNNVITTNLPDGTVVTETKTPDPRFGLAAPLVSRAEKLPSGLTRTTTTQSTATLSDPTNPLSLVSMTEQRTVNANTWLSSYVAATRTWTTQTPELRQTFTTLNPTGQVATMQRAGLLARSDSYDLRGRLNTIAQGARQNVLTYFNTLDSSNGYLQSTTDALSETTSYVRDALGRALQETAPDSTVTGFSWDPTDNLSSVTPPARPAHTMTYNSVGGLHSYDPPLLASVPNPQTVYEYDLDRHLKTETRPNGAVLSYGYDSAGRPFTITTPSGTVTNTYFGPTPCTGCAPGKLAQLTGLDGVNLAFTYDGLLPSRTTWSGPVSGAFARTYNNDFRFTTEAITPGVGSSASTFFGYDRDGLTVCASPSSCNPASSDAMTLVYHPSHGLLTSNKLGTISESLTYNGFGELTTSSATSGTTAILGEVYDSTSFPRDPLGRVQRKVETIQGTATTFDYFYDERGQLIGVTQNGAQTAAYAYDPNGNRLSATSPSGTIGATYDDQDRLLTYGNLTYTYTGNGDLQTKTDITTGASTAYQYDVFGNLKRVSLPGGDVIEYLVDGQNRRVAKKKNGALVKKWLYRDQLHPVAELDGAGNLVTRFVYASGKNSPDYVVTAGGVFRILSDQLGSPRLVVNAATGSVVQRMRHDEFGKLLEDTNPGFTPFGFAGGIYDVDSGLVRFGARDYDPVVGRWIAKDPILFDGGQANLYVYVGNDPVNRLDTTGKYDDKACNQCLQGASDAFQRCRANCVSDHITDAPICSTPGTGTQSDNAYQRCLQGCVDAGQGAEHACLAGPSCN